MRRKILKRIVVSGLIAGLVLFILVFQEYRLVDDSGLTTEHVRQEKLIGDLFYPTGKTGLPVIIFLGGSGGGLGYEEELKALALNGYSVFSLAYFKEAGLPDKLENIPLEYFENAFNWLTTKTQVDTSKLILLGVSRGAELALLLGSTYPQVKGVIAYAPSCYVLPNATDIEDDNLIPSWTFRGVAIPFAPLRKFKATTDVSVNYTTYMEPLLHETPATEVYTIKVEKIRGPVLLISGDEDLVWPADRMATRIERRLQEHGFQYEFTNTIFNGGGHDLLMFKNCYPILSSIAFRKFKLKITGQQYQFNLGGTALGVIKSKVHSREITLQFLDTFRKTPRK